MSLEADIQRSLGRIEGALAEIKNAQAAQAAQMAAIEARVRTVETHAARSGLIAGLASSVGVALIIDQFKRWMH